MSFFAIIINLPYLPYKTFYVDVSECTEGNIFGDVKGIFVNICLNNLKIFELNLKLKNKANSSDKKTMKKY